MDFKNDLIHTQPMVYHTFINAIKKNKLSHAYLIKGNEGAPLLEMAKYLAKSLICEDPNPLACNECMSCIRFDEGNYADYILLDGSKKNIKVEDIENIQKFFNNTSSEKCGKMIYIIHLLENSNRESLNALLKFLEEPADNVYAFITTYNEEKLLPTILSRAQHLKLLPLSRDKLLYECINNGLSEDDAELLSVFHSDVNTILEIANGDNYIHIKDYVFDVLEALSKSKDEALYFTQSTLIPVIKDKITARLFLDILAVAFKDIINSKLNLPLTLKAQEALIKDLSTKINNPDIHYMDIMLTRGKIELNANIALLLEHIFIGISKGE